MHQNIPIELRNIDQWVAAGEDKIPYNPRNGKPASVIDASTWGSFQDAIKSGLPHIGFVLTDQDPYCIIDLDNKPEKPITEDEHAVHEAILKSFHTYIERSKSGTGYHVVCKANLEKGRRRNSVEIYSNERYMIFTGNTVNDSPITEQQELIDGLVARMPVTTAGKDLIQVNNELSDAEVVDMAMRASNADKFNKLSVVDGWKSMKEYESQSEADFAYMSMLCFYSKDNAQCRRIFRHSPLGKRDKAQRDAYLNYAIGKIRAVEVKPMSVEDKIFMSNMIKQLKPDNSHHTIVEPRKAPPVPPKMEAGRIKENKELEFPPGLIGDMAEYFYASSRRPVREVSLIAALALMSGIAGRSFNISGTGLNQYFILLAKTGSGKEEAKHAINRMVRACRSKVPVIDEFMGPGVFSSGQAITRHLDKKPCFLSVLGEFGITLQQITHPRASSAEKMLKRVLLDIYNKSGHEDTLMESVYSDSDKNTKAVQSPNVTILGEATQVTFFEGLSPEHVSDGLIPRFTVIEYTGKRPRLNEAGGFPVPAELVQRFSEVVAVALTLQTQDACAKVSTDEDAKKLLRAYDTFCDNKINNASNEITVELWNRAHLKSLKLSALIAVGMNPNQPIVTKEAAAYAINFVDKDIKVVATRFETGDVGTGVSKQGHDIMSIIRAYLKFNSKQRESYKINSAMQGDGLITKQYLSVRCNNISSFRNHRLGSRNALSESIRDLEEAGYLQAVDASAQYGFNGVTYAITKTFPMK